MAIRTLLLTKHMSSKNFENMFKDTVNTLDDKGKTINDSSPRAEEPVIFVLVVLQYLHPVIAVFLRLDVG